MALRMGSCQVWNKACSDWTASRPLAVVWKIEHVLLGREATGAGEEA